MLFIVSCICKLPCFPLNHLNHLMLVSVWKGFWCMPATYLLWNMLLALKSGLHSPKLFILTSVHLFYTAHSNRNRVSLRPFQSHPVTIPCGCHRVMTGSAVADLFSSALVPSSMLSAHIGGEGWQLQAVVQSARDPPALSAYILKNWWQDLRKCGLNFERFFI